MAGKYTKEILTEAVVNSTSVAGVLRYLGLRNTGGGGHSHISSRIRKFGIDTSHFTGQKWSKGKTFSKRRKTPDEIFIDRSQEGIKSGTYLLRRALLEIGVPHQCNSCGISPEWNGKPLTLEINHIDGNCYNSVRENLEFLCPNCHSQKTTSNQPHKYRK